MKLHNLIASASLLLSFLHNNAMYSSSSLLLNRYAELTEDEFKSLPTDQFETLPGEGFSSIEKDFEKKFGYSIPSNPDDYKQINFEKSLTNNKIFGHLKISFTQKNVTFEKTKTEKIKQEQLKRINHNKKIKAQKKQEKIKREQEKKAIDQRIIKERKKESALKNAQKNNMRQQLTQQQPTPQPQQTNYLQQKLTIKRKLMKQYNCQTEAQLKTFFAQQCSDDEPSCMGDYINKYAAFHYDSETNSLFFFIGEEELAAFDYFCENVTQCSCNL